MNIEEYKYYYDSLKLLISIDTSKASNNLPSYKSANIKYLLKLVFTNTNCKYFDFDDILKYPTYITNFLHDDAHLLSTNGFNIISNYKGYNYNNHLFAHKLFNINNYTLDKTNFHYLNKITNLDVISKIIDEQKDMHYKICTSSYLTQEHINKLLDTDDLTNKITNLYTIARHNYFSYDGLDYKSKRDKDKIWKYISDKLSDIKDFEKCLIKIHHYLDNYQFVEKIPLTKDRISVILLVLNQQGHAALGPILRNQSLTDELLEFTLENTKEKISTILGYYMKYLVNNKNVSIESKQKINSKYYKELVFT